MPAIAMKKEVQVQAKTLSLHLKVCDCFYARLLDQDRKEIFDYEGYVPGFMPDEHFGDYVYLDIDLDTGQITNWKAPSAEEIQEWMEKKD